MDKITCIIVDDEPLAIEILESYIAKIPGLDCLRTFDSGLEALSFLSQNKVDVVFLDIQMPDITGLELAHAKLDRAAIIFTTAFQQYAINGYEIEALDYLLKPISFDRFLRSVQKLQARLPVRTESHDFIFLKVEYKIIKVRFSDILYIEGMKDYLRVVTKTKKIMTLQSFAKLMPKLPADQFIRVHKSYVVAIDKIDAFERAKIKVDATYIPIGNSFKSGFNSLLKNRMP